MTYTFENFEVKEYLSSKYDNNPNVLSRLVNNLITGVNEYGPVPKAIVIVVDGDITRQIHTRDELTATIQIGRMTEWLIREFSRVVESYRDYLPKKCKNGNNYPHLIWMNPATHKYLGNRKNFKRERQGHCINTVVKNYEDMASLQMIKIWDPEDGISVLYDTTRFTAQGLTNYWLSVDSAIRYWNTALHQKMVKQSTKHSTGAANKYKWYRKI